MTVTAAKAAPRWRAWSSWPLQARLVVLLTVIVLAALVGAGITITALLRSQLVAQVDEQLARVSTDLANVAARGLAGNPSRVNEALLPSDYYVVFNIGSETSAWRSSSAPTARGEIPEIAPRSLAEVTASAGEPFTVASRDGPTQWRVIMLPVALHTASSTPAVGTVAVALPLTAADQTVARAVEVMALAGLAALIAASLAAFLAVRHALRPLRDVESTAAAIAAGDLGRRVPQAATSTEVGRLAASLNTMLTQIENAFADRTATEARLRDFVADASHELRTPLAALRGFGELYRQGAIPPSEIDATMQRIEAEATRMGKLVADLLALARLDERQPLALQEVDLLVLAHDAAHDLRALAPQRAVRVESLTGGAPQPAVVTADEAQLRQVVANLVGNAVEHTPEGTAIELAVGDDDYGRAVFEVRDHGAGIDPALAPRLFERFARADASRSRSSGGAGLGLAIVAAIIAAHDGAVEFVPTAGGGATVRVTLPRVGEGGGAGGAGGRGRGGRRRHESSEHCGGRRRGLKWRAVAGSADRDDNSGSSV